jgi:hypothetical protein
MRKMGNGHTMSESNWGVFVCIGVLSLLLVDVVIFPDGSFLVFVIRVLVEILTHIG